MSRLFLLALLALVGLASGFAPVNTPSVVGKFIGGGIGEKREEKERGARKKFGWRRPGPSVRRFFEPVAEEERCGRDRAEEETGGWKILHDYIRMHFIGFGGSLGGIHGEQRFPSRAGVRGRDEVSQSVRLKLPHDGR